MKKNEYSKIIVESFEVDKIGNYHGWIHIRPCPGQYPFETHMHVECSKKLSENYPVGTRFEIKAKIKSTNLKPHIYSHHQWPYKVL